MSVSFAKFLRIGQLGPLVLGMDPATVELQLGPPDMRSRKQKPLILKYGPLELTFWSSRSEPPRLVQVSLSFTDGLQGLPLALRFDDPTPNAVRNIEDFARYLEQIGIRPEGTITGRHESSIILPSGVRASFFEGQLSALVLSKSVTDENRAPVLSDEHEPPVAHIRLQLQEAHNALRYGLISGALLLAWAALEAALRRTMLRVGFKGKVRVQPSILLREAYALHLLNSEEIQILESARQQRTAIAHGLTSAQVDKGIVVQVADIAEHLIGE